MPAAPALTADGLEVAFPGVRALDRAGLELLPGEIHALMGENGAGKSTLIKVLSGLLRPDHGRVRVGGRAVTLHGLADAEHAGISTVFQEIDLIPTMSVADNLILGREPTRAGWIRARASRLRARAALARVGLDLDPAIGLAQLPIAVRQLVAIARALDIRARILILDEPTSALSPRETDGLFHLLRRLRREGVAVLMVTHALAQAYEIADRITVLRNGAHVGTWLTPDLPRLALIQAMTGHAQPASPAAAPPAPTAPRPDSTSAPPALEVRALGRRRAVRPTDFSLRRGESLGIAGLLGSGRSELVRLLFGADRPDTGRVFTHGRPVAPGSVPAAIEAGMAMTPEDRRAQGLMLDLSVRDNILLALHARRGLTRPLRPRERDRLVRHYIDSLRIRTPDAETPVGSLSGGNQQKVLLARWLALQPTVLILDEPTRGIDVGARAEIESLIASLRDRGLAVVLVSSELDEIARLCTRALVLRDRARVGECTGTACTESALLAMIAGDSPPAAGARP
ncbi:MAG: sugar ABC transporter ATP-binding protein [Phycisphaerae bacterium]|nr:sugar ABC transporter ATP-binding protein [Phycisphaerae bacterium]